MFWWVLAANSCICVVAGEKSPIASVSRVASPHANSTAYGLSLSIYTRDVNRAFRAMRELESGIVYVNAPTIGAEVHLPFGGTKATGNGHREAGTAALDDRGQLTRAVIASTIGTSIEWYDFFLYSTVTPLVFAKLFFPNTDPLTGTLNAFGVYFVGFLARPVGAASATRRCTSLAR